MLDVVPYSLASKSDAEKISFLYSLMDYLFDELRPIPVGNGMICV